MKYWTARKYDLLDCASAMQKAIRRGDATTAGYFGIELYMSNYRDYVWRRLLTISAEDCWGILTQEIVALHEAWKLVTKMKKPDPKHGRIFVSKAIILLCTAKKNRDADHLTNLAYDQNRIPETEKWDGGARMPLPAYAMDVHTALGRSAGKTKADFFREEFEGLENRHPGLFDDLLEVP